MSDMASGVFGGGVIFVVAALLWAAVLVPSWVRRREFKAAEQNALRLQRTLRVLAETSEVPAEVRVEATAREALAQERILRTAQRKEEADRKAKLAEARAAQVRAEMRAQQMKRKQAALVRSAKLRRPIVRRVRALAVLVFLLAAAGIIFGAVLAFAGLGTAVLFGSLAGAAAGLGALVLLAPGRAKMVDIDAEYIVETVAKAPAAPVVESAIEDNAAAAHAAAQAVAAARIERARAMARARAAGNTQASTRQNQPHSMFLETKPESEVRQPPVGSTPAKQGVPAAGVANEAAEQPAKHAPKARPTTIANQSVEGLSQMGVVGDTSQGMLDLDSVLRTRRRAG